MCFNSCMNKKQITQVLNESLLTGQSMLCFVKGVKGAFTREEILLLNSLNEPRAILYNTNMFFNQSHRYDIFKKINSK